MIKNNLELIKSTDILGKRFKVFGTPEEPLFKASDVASWIEHSNPSKMIKDAELDDTEIVKCQITTITNSYSALFVTEYGLYEILMQSRKPIAKEFKKKVKEILKSLRVTGIYVNNGDLILETYCNNKEWQNYMQRQNYTIIYYQAKAFIIWRLLLNYLVLEEIL